MRGRGLGDAFGDGDGDGEARAAEGRRGEEGERPAPSPVDSRSPHRTTTHFTRGSGRSHRTSCARWWSSTRSPSACASRVTRVGTGRDDAWGTQRRRFTVRGVASPITTTHLLQKRRTATQSGNFCREKGGGTRAGAHRRVGRRRRMDRSHEDDVRVLVDEVLRGVSTRAHRPGAVVGAHGDAPSSRHG